MAVAYPYRCCIQFNCARQQSRPKAPRPRSHHPHPSRRGQFPITPAEPSLLTSRGFLPWRLSDTGPGVRRTLRHGPASETLHMTYRSGGVERTADVPPLAAEAIAVEHLIRPDCRKAPAHLAIAFGAEERAGKTSLRIGHPGSRRASRILSKPGGVASGSGAVFGYSRGLRSPYFHNPSKRRPATRV